MGNEKCLWTLLMVYVKENKTLSKIVVKFGFDFTTVFQNKIIQRERSVLENGVKTCPQDEFSPSCENVRKKHIIQA